MQNLNLTTGSISQKLIRFALPLMLSNLIQQLYNTADLLIVGRFVGTEAEAAIGTTGAIVNMLVGFFIGIATGCAVVVAHKFGADDTKGLHRIIHTSYALSLSCGLFISIFGVIFAKPLLQMIYTPASIMDDAQSYVSIFFAGSIAGLTYNMGAGIMRSVGDSKRPFIFLAFSAILNVVMDLLFVGVFHWGVAGAARATVIAQVISACMVTYSLATTGKNYKLYLRKIKCYPESIKQALDIGVPSGLQSVLISLSNVLIQAKVNGFGTVVIAGNAAGGRIDGFVLVLISSMGLSAMTFVGQNMGAGKLERAKKGVFQSIAIITTLCVIIGGLLLLFSWQVAALFNEDPEVVAMTRKVMFYILSMYWLFAINETLGGALRGLGRAVAPMVMTLFGLCVFRIFWLYVILPFDHTVDMLFTAYPASWVVAFFGYVGYMIVKKPFKTEQLKYKAEVLTETSESKA